VVDLPAADLLAAMAVNYGGVVAATQAVLPGMLERGRGEIVEFASLAGWLPSPKVGAYAATKAAVVSYSESLARELRGTGVRLVCVCPPVVDTPMAERARDQLGKEFEAAPPIAPEQVLDAIETALARGDLWAFPGPLTSTVWRLRRYAPEFLWRRLDAVAAR
jgi:short-subunit dehydrogenase